MDLSGNLSEKQALGLWQGTIVESVRRDGPDLSARQMAVLLTVYLTEEEHTVRGLAKLLNVSKPAITRALVKLEGLKYLRRKTDPSDKRNVLIQRTIQGSIYLQEFASLMQAVADELPQKEVRDIPNFDTSGFAAIGQTANAA
jgi:DNA-binding MarR family transcriptional regulator